MFQEFEKNNFDCMLAFSKVHDPERFGVPVFDEKMNLIDVVEKPKNPPNDFAVTGIYLYGPKIFFETFKKISKSSRGEYEISDIHSHLLKQKCKVGWKEITGWWKDTGKPDDLILANELLLGQMAPECFSIQSKELKNLKTNGCVQIGKNVLVGKNVELKGPVIIGDDCVLEDCKIGPNVTVGSGSKLVNCVISNSIIFSKCQIEAEVTVKNSIIGDGAKVVKNGIKKTHRLILGDQTLIEL